VVAVKYRYPLWIPRQVVSHCLANHKESIEGGYFVILPVVADNIMKHFFIDIPATDVDGEIFIFVMFVEKLSDGVDRVPVEFLDP
jgi:hypothetical protein